jgi:hypothetical protein
MRRDGARYRRAVRTVLVGDHFFRAALVCSVRLAVSASDGRRGSLWPLRAAAPQLGPGAIGVAIRSAQPPAGAGAEEWRSDPSRRRLRTLDASCRRRGAGRRRPADAGAAALDAAARPPLQSIGAARPGDPGRRRPAGRGRLAGAPPAHAVARIDEPAGARPQRTRRLRTAPRPQRRGQAHRADRRRVDHRRDGRGVRACCTVRGRRLSGFWCWRARCEQATDAAWEIADERI